MTSLHIAPFLHRPQHFRAATPHVLRAISEAQQSLYSVADTEASTFFSHANGYVYQGTDTLHMARGHCCRTPTVQAYVSRARAESFSLTADMMYVSQNAPRICRALFEICLRRSWSTAADMALTMCKVGTVCHPEFLAPCLLWWLALHHVALLPPPYGMDL